MRSSSECKRIEEPHLADSFLSQPPHNFHPLHICYTRRQFAYMSVYYPTPLPQENLLEELPTSLCYLSGLRSLYVTELCDVTCPAG